MKHIHVTCAIIEKDGRVLAAQRSETMNLPLKWEFPGGKVKDGEKLEECLKREAQEELGVEIVVGQPLTPATHRYPTFTVTLYPFLCRIASGTITLHEHKAMAWLAPKRLLELDWADADGPILIEYLSILAGPR